MGQMGEFNANSLPPLAFSPPPLSPTSALNTVTPDDILHCLTRFGQPGLNIETLHRVDTFFGHQGRFLEGYERRHHNPVYSWLVDHFSTSPIISQAALDERSRVVMELYENYSKSPGSKPKSPAAFMNVLRLAHAFAPNTVLDDIPSLAFPTEGGRPCWPFDRPGDLIEILKELNDQAKFNATHPAGADSLSCGCSGAPAQTGTTAPLLAW